MFGKILKLKNVRKTLRYARKNGMKHTYYAARERAVREIGDSYRYEEPLEEELRKQRRISAEFTYKFSILVPAYETPKEYLDQMIRSVLDQSYPNLELIIADASSGDGVKDTVEGYLESDRRIRYLKLEENQGISVNTNKALQYATGDYVGLLDHDDYLSPDALYEVAAAIGRKEQEEVIPELIYSDEDKCDSEAKDFFEPNLKPDFNLDMLLSNNYICHFLVIKKELFQMLELRSAYDGAQDYDLILRAVHTLMGKPVTKAVEERLLDIRRLKERILHIPKVLYHWRSHQASTSDNTDSKSYAYVAGKKAVEDFLRKRGWNGEVRHTLHLGFYRVEYEPDILNVRPEVGIVGGRLLNRKHKIIGGNYGPEGEVLYYGLHREYSGCMHRASLIQEAFAVDIRCMEVSPEAEHFIEEVLGLPYLKNLNTGRFNWRECMKKEADFKRISLEFCEKVRNAGYLIIWDPEMQEKIKDREWEGKEG